MDSGATNHMVSDRSLLNAYLIVDNPGNVQLPNGESAVITQFGHCQLERGGVVV